MSGHKQSKSGGWVSVKRVGGLVHWRVGRLGGSFYLRSRPSAEYGYSRGVRGGRGSNSKSRYDNGRVVDLAPSQWRVVG